MRDDAVGERRPDARERLDLALGGVVEIDGTGCLGRAATIATNRLFGN